MIVVFSARARSVMLSGMRADDADSAARSAMKRSDRAYGVPMTGLVIGEWSPTAVPVEDQRAA